MSSGSCDSRMATRDSKEEAKKRCVVWCSDLLGLVSEKVLCYA